MTIEMEFIRDGDQHIFPVVMTMNDSDNPGCVFFGRNLCTKSIYAKRFAIIVCNMRDMANMKRIDPIRKLGMETIY